MVIKYAFLADYASVDAGGKISAAGLFDIINVQGFPAMVPPLFLVVRVEGTVNEKDPHQFSVEWRDDKGNKLNSFDQTIELKGPGVTHGSLSAQMIFQFQGLIFPKAGPYEFVIFSDGRWLARVVFAVKKLAGVK